jgi:O-antigen ligase
MNYVNATIRYDNFFERETGSLSRAYWSLPFIMVFRYSFLLRTRAGTEYAALDAYSFVNIVTTGIIIFVLLSKRYIVATALRDSGVEIKFIIAYYCLCILSGIWSTSLAYSSYRATEYLANFMIVMLLIHGIGDFIRVERFVLLAGLVIVVMQMAGAFLYAGWGYFGTNNDPVTSGILFIYAFGEFATATEERKTLLRLTSVLGFGALALVGSTGTNLAIVLTLGLLLIISPFHWKYIIFVLLAGFLISDLSLIEQVLFPGKSIEGIVNLKHRAGIWESSWELYLQKPFLGYGFGGVATKHYLSIQSAHNNVLEILLDCGIAGAVLMLGAYVTLLTRTFRGFLRYERGAVGCFAALIFFFINNLSVPVFGSAWNTTNTVFTLLLGLFTYHIAPRDRVLN